MTETTFVGFESESLSGNYTKPMIVFTSEKEVKKWCAVDSERRYKQVAIFTKFDTWLKERVEEMFP